jgi:hypothetical protein
VAGGERKIVITAPGGDATSSGISYAVMPHRISAFVLEQFTDAAFGGQHDEDDEDNFDRGQ